MTYKEFKEEIKNIEKKFCVKIKYNKDEIKDMKPAQRKARIDSLTLRLLFIKTMTENLDGEKEDTTNDEQNTANNEQNTAENNTNDIEKILEERGSVYGDFYTLSMLSTSLKDKAISHIYNIGNEDQFEPYMEEALGMIFHKIARIVNGDPSYIDSWKDIAGYAQLVVDELENGLSKS